MSCQQKVKSAMIAAHKSKEEVIMVSVKNGENKKVCQIDPQTRSIEIVKSGFRTVIRFLDDGTYEIINTKVA